MRSKADLEIEFMETQIELYRRQLRWEPWKALAAIMVAAAAISAAGRLADLIHPPAPQTISVHLDSPLVIQGPR